MKLQNSKIDTNPLVFQIRESKLNRKFAEREKQAHTHARARTHTHTHTHTKIHEVLPQPNQYSYNVI